MKRNLFNLRNLTDYHRPQLLFLSEHMLFQSDLPGIVQYFRGEYSFSLNSEDLYNPELSLTSSRAKGGTLVMWEKRLDPYLSVHLFSSPAFLPVVIDIPGFKTMIHIAVYLPTSGKEAEFLDELSNLKNAVENLLTKHPSAAVFIRGDCNASLSNPRRNKVFSKFIYDMQLTRVELQHNTYHHFQGNGASDSELDVIMFSNQHGVVEDLLEIVCQQVNPLIDSHHDLLLSVLTVPPCAHSHPDKSSNITAPRLANTRHRIIWNEEETAFYQSLVTDHLVRVRDNWLDATSESSVSILMETTNMILTEAALTCNKSVQLSSKKCPKSTKIPPCITRSNKALARIARKMRIQSKDPRYLPSVIQQTRDRYKNQKLIHRRLVRKQRMIENNKRDSDTFAVMNGDNKKLFQSIKALKNSGNMTSIKKLHTRDKIYEGDQVCDGFYDSINYLKTEAHINLESSESYNFVCAEHERILRLCQEGSKIPEISLEQTSKILSSIRPGVSDFASITGYHYLYAGAEGILHLRDLLNVLIKNVNNMTVDGVNIASACILYKGHGKNRSNADSYRTISSCPLVSKALDTYLAQLYSSIWEKHQASTQFQGKSSTHELAALLLTETVQHSLYVNKKPAFVLYLDAQSAFDLVLREVLINKLYHYGIQDQGLLLLNERLKNRKTICEWNGNVMGPISDKWGLEQGGVNCSEFYKVYNNQQLTLAQESQLGVDLGGPDPLVVSAIGQADDVALVSDSIFALQSLLDLSLRYCREHHVTLRADKTKLQAFSSDKTSLSAYYAKVVSPINVYGTPVEFADEAEHVGFLRSTAGNLPHILNRLSAHKKALAAVLPFGLAHRHRGNPAAVLRLHNLYATPVLFSCLSAALLQSSEVDMLDKYLKNKLLNLQKLMERTPACVVYFLSGTLPASAQLHIRQLCLFGMVTRLPGSILYKHAVHVLTSAKVLTSSWFPKIRELCLLYQLPHPLDLLHHPLLKKNFQKLVKSRVIDHWEVLLRSESASLTSIPYFKPQFMTLMRPHPLWSSCGPNPFEVHKAVTAARMLSGRYLTDKLQRHWTLNRDGVCLLPNCSPESEGSLEHIMLVCTSLSETRAKLFSLSSEIVAEHEALAEIITHIFCSNIQSSVMQLLLDCTAIPEVVSAVQVYGPVIRDRLLYLGRTWCYSIHRERMNQLGLVTFR